MGGDRVGRGGAVKVLEIALGKKLHLLLERVLDLLHSRWLLGNGMRPSSMPDH